MLANTISNPTSQYFSFVEDAFSLAKPIHKLYNEEIIKNSDPVNKNKIILSANKTKLIMYKYDFILKNIFLGILIITLHIL